MQLIRRQSVTLGLCSTSVCENRYTWYEISLLVNLSVYWHRHLQLAMTSPSYFLSNSKSVILVGYVILRHTL